MPHTILAVIGLKQDGTPVVHVPDDPAASAQVSGPTDRTLGIPGEDLARVFEALPVQASNQATSIAQQRIAELEAAASEAAADLHQRETTATEARKSIDRLVTLRRKGRA